MHARSGVASLSALYERATLQRPLSGGADALGDEGGSRAIALPLHLHTFDSFASYASRRILPQRDPNCLGGPWRLKLDPTGSTRTRGEGAEYGLGSNTRRTRAKPTHRAPAASDYYRDSPATLGDMDVDLIVQDPLGKSGTASVVAWIVRYFRARGASYGRMHVVPELPNTRPALLASLPAYAREGDTAVVYSHHGRRLHFVQYRIARRQARDLEWPVDGAVVAGATLISGSIVPENCRLRAAWFGTTIADEHRHRTKLLSPTRRVLHGLTTPQLIRLESRTIRRAEVLLPQSSHSADQLLANGVPASRIEVLPVPVDTAEFFAAEASTQRGPAVIFVGRANDPRKGLSGYLAEHARSRYLIAAGLTVVSREPPEGYTPQQLAELNVKVTGWVEDLGSLMRNHSILVLPSTQEGLGIVVLEAMASGLGVVALPCGGPEAIIRDSGAGLVAENVERMADLVSELIDSPQLQAMGSLGPQWVAANAVEDVVFSQLDSILYG